MGHRVAVMNKGALQQLDTPRNLYDHPVNLFVASFIGSPPINFFEGLVGQADGAPVVQLGSFTLSLGAFAARAAAYHDRKVIVGIRPEALKLTEATEGMGIIAARTAFVEDLGATLLVQLDVDAANLVQARVAEEEDDLKAIRPRMRAMIDGVLAIAAGDVLSFAVDPAAIHLFDADTGMAL